MTGRTAAFVPLVGIGLVMVLAAQEPQCRLEGRVVDPMRVPVRGAVVTAEIAGEVLAETRTDGEGLFAFARLPMRVLTIRATARGEVGGEWVDLLGLEREFTTIVTMPARVVKGVVRDDAGNVVPRAFVLAAPVSCDSLALATCWTEADDQGAFVLRHVAFGKCLLRAWAPGTDAFEGEVDGDDDAVAECVVEKDAVQERVWRVDGAAASDAPGLRLDVTVRHAGFPLPLPAALRRPAFVDDRWTVLGWPFADEMAVVVTCERCNVSPGGFLIPVDTASRTSTFAAASTGSPVLGRIRDPGTTPTWIVAEPSTEGGPPVRTFARVRDDGSFSLAPPVAPDSPFRARLISANTMIEPGGKVLAGWIHLEHSPSTVHEIPTAPAAAVRARVVRTDGSPVAGARVRILIMTASNAGRRWRLGVGHEIATGRTQIDGRVEIAGCESGGEPTLTCLVESDDGFVRHEFKASRERVDLGALTVTPGAELLVISTTADGRRAPGTRLRLSLFATLVQGVPTQHYATDRNGELRLRGLRADGGLVSVIDEPAEDFELQPGTVTTVTLELPAPK